MTMHVEAGRGEGTTVALPPHSSYRGYMYIAVSAFLWAVSATLGRAAFTGQLLPKERALRPIDPLIMSQARTTISLLVLLPVLGLRRGLAGLRMPRLDLGRVLLIGLLGLVPSNYFYYLAIQRTNVATAIVVQYTAPIWVLLYMVGRGLQRATLQRMATVLLAISGIVLVIDLFHTGLKLDRTGILSALLAAFAFAFYNVAGHSVLARCDRWTVLFYSLLSAALFWLCVNSPAKVIAAHYSGEQWIFLFVFALTSVLLPYSLYFAGLQHLEPTSAIVVSCLEPVFSILLAALVLHELVGPMQGVGVLLVLVAIVLVQLPDRRGADKAATVIEPIE